MDACAHDVHLHCPGSTSAADEISRFAFSTDSAETSATAADSDGDQVLKRRRAGRSGTLKLRHALATPLLAFVDKLPEAQTALPDTLCAAGLADAATAADIFWWMVTTDSCEAVHAGVEVLPVCVEGSSWAGMPFPALSDVPETATTVDGGVVRDAVHAGLFSVQLEQG